MVVASSNRSGVSPQLRVPTADDASRLPGGGLYLEEYGFFYLIRLKGESTRKRGTVQLTTCGRPR